MKKQMEGDNTERRNRAREARNEGHTPSEALVTTGASKQRHHEARHVSAGSPEEAHQEHMDAISKGKRGPHTSGKPRPGDRTFDPKRTSRWE